MLLLAVGVWWAVPHIPDDRGPSSPWLLVPRGPGDHVMMVVQYALSAFAEELVTRAYLITRLKALLGSRGEAVLVAALLFASYHAYQGLSGAVDALAFGLAYGVAFLALGRVWPLVVGHALFNIRLELLLV
jgi:membrane protease YdiL (CAAX protease family)